MPKVALITGVTGQDGAYLSKFLLDKGYVVVGMKRRTSLINTTRLDENDIYSHPNFRLEYGNMSDGSSLHRLLLKHRPDEIYNLAAQSHVRVSFDVPEETVDVVANGTLRLLEAYREICPTSRFYQASSSEMYGDNVQVPQNEETRMTPASPYACAKLFSHNICRNYRESYKLHISSGILFNHECVDETTPLLVRDTRGVVSIATPTDLVALCRKGTNVQTFWPKGLEVWDGTNWTGIRVITATKRRSGNQDHKMILTQTRGGTIATTAHHHMLTDTFEEIEARNVAVGQRMALCSAVPMATNKTVVSRELAALLGYLAGDGYVSDGAGGSHTRFINNDDALRKEVQDLWFRLFLGTESNKSNVSGFAPFNPVKYVDLCGADQGVRQWLRDQLYTSTKYKKVPDIILNADLETQKVFLDAYYACDGLKKGNSDSFVTNSSVLARGLIWMYELQGYKHTVYVEERNSTQYYRVNLRKPGTVKGRHLIKPSNEVRKLSDYSDSGSEFVFDFETESGVFNAGVGNLVIHNSPLRGETFVTRKIAIAAARIKAGLQDKLSLGNLEAKRDWGYAPDYVEAMWLMLQQEHPDDYVVATGETHTVKEFAEETFRIAGLNLEDHLVIDQRLFRPHEVPLLLGDATKAKNKLGWTPKTKFKDLVRVMFDAEMSKHIKS